MLITINCKKLSQNEKILNFIQSCRCRAHDECMER